MKTVPVFLITILMLLTAARCTHHKKTISPQEYDLTKPTVYTMPSVLDEISGVTFKNGNPDTIYAEQDEEGKVFYFHPGDKEVQHTKFSKKGDYEDIAVYNGYIIMLRSDGVFFTFPLGDIYNKEAANVNEQQGLLPEGEYESLYADENSKTLYVLCKNCGNDKVDQTIPGYTLQLDAEGKLRLKDTFSIDEKIIAALAGEKKIRFKPSALAKNPLTNEWYIISSVNKMLLVTDSQWKPIKTYRLNAAFFTQPEGIAFDKNGNLYISNETGEGYNGTILQFLLNK
jgi:DNA-binding beta-propeller fold protein YncE